MSIPSKPEPRPPPMSAELDSVRRLIADASDPELVILLARLGASSAVAMLLERIGGDAHARATLRALRDKHPHWFEGL